MSPPTPLGGHLRTPLGAFVRTPLGAFGSVAEATELIYTGTVTSVVFEDFENPPFNTEGYLIYTDGNQWSGDCGRFLNNGKDGYYTQAWNAIFGLSRVGPTGDPKGGPMAGWRVLGLTSGAEWILAQQEQTLVCSQFVASADRDTWWSDSRLFDPSFNADVPIRSFRARTQFAGASVGLDLATNESFEGWVQGENVEVYGPPPPW